MKRFAGALNAIALLGSVAQAPAYAQDDAAVFKPTTQWAVEFGEDYCRLARDFSDGKDTISLAMERIQPGNAVRLLLVGDAIKTFRGADQLGYRYLPSGDNRMVLPSRGTARNGQQFINFGDIFVGPALKFPAPGETPAPPPPYTRQSELDYAGGIDAIMLTDGMINPIRIETGSLKPPIEVVQNCADDLLKYWGLDPDAHKNLQRPVFPAADATKWLPSGTIGFEDFGKLSGGSNQVRVLIDATGKPTACHVHWPSLAQATNDKICKALMEKGTFMPALDSGGKAIASYWTVAPFFLLPPPPGFGR
jgi:hypothetical protein